MRKFKPKEKEVRFFGTERLYEGVFRYGGRGTRDFESLNLIGNKVGLEDTARG